MNSGLACCFLVVISLIFTACTRHESPPSDEGESKSSAGEVRSESKDEWWSAVDEQSEVVERRELAVEGHPHLLLSAARVSEIRSRIESDPLMSELQEYLYATAVSYLPLSPVVHKTTGPAMLAQSRAAIGRILAWSLQYHLTGEERFAARARKELLVVCAFPDWYPRQFLSIAEMSLAVSIGYDWLYDYLSEEDREVIRHALVENALSYAPSAYGVLQEGKRSQWSAIGEGGTSTNNWNQVCNGGLLVAALVLREEEPELSRIVVDGAIKSLPRAMVNYGPDGAWPEGPIYWAYATSYNVVAIALLEDAFGTDYGLSEQPGFDQAANFFLQAFGATGAAFNYGDAGMGMSHQVGCQPAFSWLAKRFGPEIAIPVARERMRGFLADPISDYSASKLKGTSARFGPLHALWFPSEPEVESAESLQLDSHFGGVSDLAFFRSEWGNTDALWLGFKAGTNGFAHSHLDLGSFVLEANGVRWALDLGADNYRLPGYWRYGVGGQRWKYFRMNNLSHNIIGPEGVLQDPTAMAPITEFGSFDTGGFAICDITSAFPGVADRALRGVAMLGRNRILLQDEWSGYDKKRPLVWRMMTGTSIELIDGGRTALLSADGEQLRVQILEPRSATFSSVSARPETEEERQNGNSRILQIRHDPVQGDTRVAVLFSPVGPSWPDLAEPKVAPLSEWAKFSKREN